MRNIATAQAIAALYASGVIAVSPALAAADDRSNDPPPPRPKRRDIVHYESPKPMSKRRKRRLRGKAKEPQQ